MLRYQHSSKRGKNAQQNKQEQGVKRRANGFDDELWAKQKG